MQPSLTQVRRAIANRLGSLGGIPTVYAEVPANITAPCLIIIPADSVGEQKLGSESFSGQRRYLFDVRIYLPAEDQFLGQQQLDPYLSDQGSQSIERTIMDDPTLGNVVDCCTTHGWPTYGSVILAKDSPTSRQIIVAIVRLEVLL